MSFESVTERLKRLEMEISELRLSIEASRTEESETKRRGDQLRGEVAGLNGRRSSLEGLIRDHSYSTDTVKNIFRVGAKRRSESGQQNDTLGTLADFLEVDGAYEQVVDEFLREELNYIVVKNWEAADQGIKLLKSRSRGGRRFWWSRRGSCGGTGEHSRPQGEGVRPLTECMRVLNGFGRSLEVLLPKLREGFVAPDAETARALAVEFPEGYFLAPTGETFHHLMVTGGRPSSGGPLALKRELREVRRKLAALEAGAGEDGPAHGSSCSMSLPGRMRAIEAKNHERRDAEREAANSGAALRQMESETARIERRLQEWMLATDRNRDARNQKADFIAQRQQLAAEVEAERSALEAGLAALTVEVEQLRGRREELQRGGGSGGGAGGARGTSPECAGELRADDAALQRAAAAGGAAGWVVDGGSK